MSISNLNISRTNKSNLATFGEAFYAPGGVCGPRIQSDYQLVFITRATASVVIDGTRIPLETSSAVLCRPGSEETFEFDRDADCAHLWVAVSPESVPDELKSRIWAQAQYRCEIGTIEPLIRLGLASRGDRFLDALALAILEGFLAPLSKPQSDPLQLALNFITGSLHRPIDLRDIAASAFVTPQHLTRVFRNHLGITPTRYLWQERTRKGVALLSSTGLGVAEISIQLGFRSPFHFSRLVRQATGKSPRELRKSLWSG